MRATASCRLHDNVIAYRLRPAYPLSIYLACVILLLSLPFFLQAIFVSRKHIILIDYLKAKRVRMKPLKNIKTTCSLRTFQYFIRSIINLTRSLLLLKYFNYVNFAIWKSRKMNNCIRSFFFNMHNYLHWV